MPNYTLPDGFTVKNKLGAYSHDELEKLEGNFVFFRIAELTAGKGPTGQFDAAHLKAIHGHIFQDVCEWAGHTRDEKIRLSDGTIASEPQLMKIGGRPFIPGSEINHALDRFSEAIRHDYHLRGLPRLEFASRAADLLVTLNEIHPFREGNGRTQRLFLKELAEGAGHMLDFSVVTKERMIQASIAAHEQGDNGMPHRVAALRPALEAMTRHNFPWNENYVATMEPGHSVPAMMAGVAGDHFMARSAHAVLIGQGHDLPSPIPRLGQEFQATASDWPTPESNPRATNRPGVSQ